VTQETKHIVIVGDPASGFAFHGPFDTPDDAITWAENEIKGEWSVSELEPTTFYMDEG